MTGRKEAHEELKRALELPEYYGKNLDALWDMLTQMQGEVVLKNAAEMLNEMKGYGCKLIQTMYDAAEKNKGLIFRAE